MLLLKILVSTVRFCPWPPFNQSLTLSCDFQATLSPESLERVRKAISACSDGRFEFHWNSEQQEPEVTTTGMEKADELINALAEAV